MYVNSSDGRSYCRLAAYLRYKPGTGNSLAGFNPDYQMLYAGDDVFWSDNSTDAPGFISDWLPTAECLGIPRSDFEHPFEVPFHVHKPHIQRYDSREDERRYYMTGSTFFSGFPDSTFAKENGVVHTRFVGDVGDLYEKGNLFYTQSSGFPSGQANTVPFHKWSISPYGTIGAARIGTNPKGQGIFELRIDPYGFYPTFSLETQLEAWDQWFSAHDILDVYKGYSYYYGTYRNWINNSSLGHWAQEAGVNHGVFDVEYDYDLSWNRIHAGGEPGSYATFHVHHLVYFRFDPFFGSNSPVATNFPTKSCIQINDLSSVSIVSQNIRYGGSASLGTLPIRECYSTTIAGPLLQVEDTDVPNFVTYRFADKNFLNRRTDLFFRSVNDVFGDIRPSSFLSSADALNKHLLALTANHVQTLSQLDGILGLLPDLVALPGLVKKISSGDYSAIKDLIDYITDAILKFRFAQAPNAKNLQEVLGTDVQTFLDNLVRTTSVTIYGDFKWSFPEAKNFMEDGELVLETRSKLRVTSDASTLVTTCLMANAVGLLPTLSRIWESLPLSFLIDWFTGMNKRLKLLDTQLLYMAFRTDWCLNSYKVTYYPSPEKLELFNLESINPDKPFGLSVYIREKSVYMPRLRESQYDFVTVSGANPVTAGAFAWQRLL